MKTLILSLIFLTTPFLGNCQKTFIDSILVESEELSRLKIDILKIEKAHEILAGQTDKIHDTADLLISWSGIVFTIFTLLLAFASIYTGIQINEVRKLKDELKQTIIEYKYKLVSQNEEIEKIKIKFEEEKERSLKLLFPLIEGHWNFYQGNYKKALELYKEVQEIEPNHPRILKQYYWLLTNTGNVKESISKLESLIKQYPNDNEIKLRLSVAYRRDNQFEDAEKIAKDLAEKEGFAPAYYDYGSILLRKGEFENAEKMFTSANKHFSESGEVPKYWVFLNLAISQIAIGKIEEAKINTESAITLIENKMVKTPNNPHLYMSLGIAKLFLNKNEKTAIQLVKDSILKDLPIEHAKSIIEKLNYVKGMVSSDNLNEVVKTLEQYCLNNK